MKKITILIPSSLTMEIADEKIRAYRVGQIARAASIFRVDEIVIYRDRSFDDTAFIRELLEYANCPPHLKRQLFPISKNLRFAGIIPPLQTPSHPQHKSIEVGEFRMGLVKGRNVDIGLNELAVIKKGTGEEAGVVTVRITSIDPPEVEIVDPASIPCYWGYRVRVRKSLFKALRDRKLNGRVIFTSKTGDIVDIALLKDLKEYVDLDRIVLVFGSPSRGIEEILRDDNHTMAEFGYPVINVVKQQGTATVRLEEALVATLTICNLFLS
ncbi:hypothetical protein DRN98_04745 [Methanosarcinales archaeon]|nr:MAG: hypothetical protein DRN98_04745 [Methanosarcinales archaeon]